jgi:PTH1 family peptidyl-tRNA hydrolase
MLLLVGLGNPGPQYAKTRHNIGFMVVDAIAHEYGFSSCAKKFRSEWYEGVVNGEKASILKPKTFMNLSGEAVGEACRFYKIPLEKIVVFHDDIDLPFDTLKIKKSGGSAGHNGLKSIDAHIGNDYLRIRIGIGKQHDTIAHVLDAFTPSEMKIVEKIVTRLSKEFYDMIKHFHDMGAKNLKFENFSSNQIITGSSAANS